MSIATEPLAIEVHRIEVPIDDQWHPLTNCGADVLHVDTRKPGVVELWVERHYMYGQVVEYATKHVRVFGTGQRIQDAKALYHAGSVVDRASSAEGALVWHVYVGDER